MNDTENTICVTSCPSCGTPVQAIKEKEDDPITYRPISPLKKKVTTFDVLNVMCERNLDIRLSTLDNVTQAQKTKHGSKVTIGVVGDVVTGVAMGRFCGGLLLADSKQFNEIKQELELANGQEPKAAS
jgi:hypothetical protein